MCLFCLSSQVCFQFLVGVIYIEIWVHWRKVSLIINWFCFFIIVSKWVERFKQTLCEIISTRQWSRRYPKEFFFYLLRHWRYSLIWKSMYVLKLIAAFTYSNQLIGETKTYFLPARHAKVEQKWAAIALTHRDSGLLSSSASDSRFGRSRRFLLGLLWLVNTCDMQYEMQGFEWSVLVRTDRLLCC